MNRAVETVDGLREKIANLPRTWRLGSTCSGCGTFELAARAVASAMSGCLPVADEESYVVSCLVD